MEEKFKSWLVSAEGKLEATGRSYSRAINRLSERYSSFTGNPIDIYNVDVELLTKIKNSYESNGRFSEVGHESHGLNRAAIKAFYRYRRSHPASPSISNVKASTKYFIKRKEAKRKTYAQGIWEFFTNIFQKKYLQKIPSGNFVGTKKQIFEHLLPLLSIWEKEVRIKYLEDHPRCERCKSIEFPRVMEKHPIHPKKLLAMVLKDLPERQKLSVSNSALKVEYKNLFTNDQRLKVFCRTCNQKEEDRKVEHFRHEAPPIMRKDPPELWY